MAVDPTMPYDKREDLEGWLRRAGAEPTGYAIDPFVGMVPEPPVQPDPRLRAMQEMMLAGDVVPMPQQNIQSAIERLSQTPYQSTRGAGAISQFGGTQSPTLDLMNILSYPSGQSMSPMYRRPR